MTLEERREQLVEELGRLIEAVVSPDTFPLRGPDGSAPEGSLLAEQERLLKEKTAELDAINARMQSPYYRFHEVSSMLRGVLWLAAVPLALLALFCFIPLGEWLLTFVSGFLLVWAIWSSAPIKA